MSLALDAIILFTAIFIIWAGARRGFVRSFMSVFSTFASLIAAYAYTPMLAEHVNEKLILSPIAGDINATLISLSRNPATDSFDLGELAVKVPQPLVNILDRYNVDLNSFLQKISGLIGVGEDTVYTYAEEIAAPTANVISAVIAFVALFFAANLALKLLTGIIDLIFRLPVLKAANTALGVVFGIVEAALVVCVLAVALTTLVETMGAIDPELFGADAVDKTLIARHIDDIGFFERIKDILH